MTTMEKENYRLKMAVIAGASSALKYKDKKLRATTEEVIQHITENVAGIIKEIDEGEED